MLLIAQPKSASTSLMWSISKILKITHKNGQNKRAGDRNPAAFEELIKYHGTMVIREDAFLKKYLFAKNIIYKEHILPIKQHFNILDKYQKPFVILTRDPAECVESYKRVFSVLPEVKVDYKILGQELNDFIDFYVDKYDKKNYVLFVDYKDITRDFTNTIKKIIIHYGFNVPDDIGGYELEKRNYSWSKT